MRTTWERRGREAQRVLLVDPDDEMLARVARGLREEGFRVVAVGRREAAVPVFSAFQPDAVVLAARHPEDVPSGLARQLRALAQGALPLTYLVPSADLQMRRQCLEAGLGLDVVRLPADPGELAARVRAQLRFQEGLVTRLRKAAEAPGTALRDPLTGAASRRYLLALVEEEIRRAERHGGTFSVAAARMRGLASLRKAAGRRTAERVLVWATLVLGQALRESDVVARAGASEFALLLPRTPAEAVVPLLGRVRARLALARFELGGRLLRLEMDFGAASFPDQTGTARQVVGAAFRELRQRRALRDGALASQLSAS